MTQSGAPSIGLMRAVGEKNMEALQQHIAAGSNLNLLSATLDRTPLMEAALQDWEEGIAALAAAGADVNAKNGAGVTAVVIAVSRYRRKALAALAAAGADLSVTDETGESLLGLTSRRWMAQDITQQLISLGAPMNMKGADGKTPLMRSMDEPDSNHIASKYLIEGGADIELRDAAGNTPLIRAAEKADSKVAGWLLERGADIDAVNGEGFCARDYALQKVDMAGLRGLYAGEILQHIDAVVEARAAAARARMATRQGTLRGKAVKLKPSP